jgi:DNA-binding NtrC family response regulator
MMVLLVDDDDDFRSAMADSLRDDGLTVDEFASTTAMPPLSTLGHYDLLIADYRMTPETGLDLILRFQEAHPGKAAILVTAFAGPEVDRVLTGRERTWLLRKPFAFDALRALIASALS